MNSIKYVFEIIDFDMVYMLILIHNSNVDSVNYSENEKLTGQQG